MSQTEEDSEEEAFSENGSGDDDLHDDEHLYEDWDDLASDPEEVSRLQRTLEGLLPDIVKRGVDGLVSEDGIRSIVKDRGIPREAVGFILGQVDATKREVLRIVSREVRLFLQNVDLGGELTKILTSVSFEIRTEVRFVPNDSKLKPEVKNRVSMRGEDGEEATLSEPLDETSDGDSEQTEGQGGEDDASDEPSETSKKEDEDKPRRRWGGLGPRRKSERSKKEDVDDGGDEESDDR